MKSQSKNPIPLPIHFKTPGRSYSQIGRKGNVALYSVYSDYFSFPDFALPYVLIGFELIVIKTKNGVERYPRPWQFRHHRLVNPKSFSRTRRTRFGRSFFMQWPICLSKSPQVFNRSATSEVAAHLEKAESKADQTSAKVLETVTELSPGRLALGELMISNP
jgi:hypothetical protein